jgi:DNA polymerase-1
MAGLDFVTSMHTDIPYYKDDGKKWFKNPGAWEDFWQYNAMDAISTASAHSSQMSQLMQLGNVETYDRQRSLVLPLLFMMNRGIRVDVQGMLEERDLTGIEISRLEEELNQLAGQPLNHQSPKQLAEYLYGKRGYHPYKKRNSKGSWSISTDVDALKRLSRSGAPEAKIILKLRKLSKRLGTYLQISKPDQDGRFRTHYKPDGADTGRLASGETIFGKGGNAQNWPHDLLKYFQFDDGYLGYSIDLSQIENRIVAYVGEVGPMIDAFEQGMDVHSLTAALIFSKPISEVTREDGTCPLGGGEHSERFWGKKANHGLNYDFGYKSFAITYEIPESEAKWIVEKYHSAYPGVRHNYHKMIKTQLQRSRTITNLFGRKRIFHEDLDDKVFKAAYSHIPQSTTADKINEHGIRYIYYNQSKFGPIELLAQVHDSIVFQIPLSIPFSEHARMLLDIKSSLEQPLEWKGKKFEVPADLSIGLNMSKACMKELKSKQILSHEFLTHYLEETHKELSNEAQAQTA